MYTHNKGRHSYSPCLLIDVSSRTWPQTIIRFLVGGSEYYYSWYIFMFIHWKWISKHSGQKGCHPPYVPVPWELGSLWQAFLFQLSECPTSLFNVCPCDLPLTCAQCPSHVHECAARSSCSHPSCGLDDTHNGHRTPSQRMTWGFWILSFKAHSSEDSLRRWLTDCLPSLSVESEQNSQLTYQPGKSLWASLPWWRTALGR